MELKTWEYLTERWDSADRERARIDSAASVFFETLMRNDWVAATQLLQRGCSPNMALGQKNALMIAAEHGSLECVKLLLSARASLNAQDEFGKDAVFWAVEGGHAQCLTLLLSKNPKLHRLFADNQTPLMRAAIQSDVESVRALVHYRKASVNEVDSTGRTALWHVLVKEELSNEDNEIARILMDNGANPDQVDLEGVSPREASQAEAAKSLLERHDLEVSITPEADMDVEPEVQTPKRHNGPRL